VPATKRAFSLQPVMLSTTPQFLVGAQAEALEQRIYGRIRDRAYELFEQSDRAPGNEDANWSQAESEVLRAGLQVRESGTWLTVNAVLADASGEDIQIGLKPNRVLVSAPVAGCERNSSSDGTNYEDEIFLAVNLQVEIDLASAAASFRDHRLRIMIKKHR